MTQALKEEFIQYLQDINADGFELPEYLSGFRFVACLQDNPQKKTFVLENDEGRKILCKYASAESQQMLKTEEVVFNMKKFFFLPYIIDYRETADGAFLLREYIEGRTLSELVEENGPLSIEEALPITRDICRTLSSLHSMTPPMIHRDIKPSNIILAESGECFLVDMGTVRRYQEGILTDTICMGTVDFAAPEQFGARQTDCRTDIYGFGLLLYYLLTGEKKIEKTSLAGLPARVAAIIRKCTAFNPDERYENIERVETALASLKPDKKVLFTKIWALAASVLSLVLLLALLVPKLLPTSERIKFSSALLEQAVREELGKTNGEPVYASDLEQITQILICGTTVFHDKEEHGRWTTPHTVGDKECAAGDIYDISLLARMPNLHYLILDDQPITDISPLKGLPLILVSISDTHVNDLAPLAGNRDLLSLDFSFTPVKSFAPLADLNISNMYSRETIATDYEYVGTLPLTELELRNVSPDALPYLKKIPTLQRLHIVDSGLTSAQELVGLDAVRFLFITGNRISSLEGIEDLNSVGYLDLGNNPFTDPTPLTRMSNLFTLRVTDCKGIRDFAFLNDIPSLQDIYVDEDQLACLERDIPQPWFEIHSP